MVTPELVDVEVLLPEIWTFHELGPDERAATEAEMIEWLDGKVDDPASVAADSMTEFFERVGAGARPMLLASIREEMDDGSLLSASLVVTKNDLGGSLEPWRAAYGDDVDEVTVLDAPALRLASTLRVDAGDLFDAPLQVVSWKYVVPFDDRSVFVFSFSSPNHELADSLLEHFDTIMSEISIEPSTP